MLRIKYRIKIKFIQETIACIVNDVKAVPDILLMLLTLSFCLRHQSSGILSRAQLPLPGIVWREREPSTGIKVTLLISTQRGGNAYEETIKYLFMHISFSYLMYWAHAHCILAYAVLRRGWSNRNVKYSCPVFQFTVNIVFAD